MHVLSKTFLASALFVMLGSPLSPLVSTAQAAPASSSANTLAPMVAPIALYPDPLLAQVLTASLYPDQITAASRWLKANPNLSGANAARGAAKQRWHASVQSLIQFPSVLHSMASQPAWARNLGDAYRRDPAQVMASVQQLRQQAQKAGTLANSAQQHVVVNQQYISIEPANPKVVYVPTYDPTYVYGTWAYAAPPVYVVPRTTLGSAVATGIGFGVGVAVANAMWGDISWKDNRTVVNNYYSDNSIYQDNRSSTTVNNNDNSVNVDNSDRSSHYEDNSSHSDDHSSHSSSYDDHSDNSSSYDDHSDNSSSYEDNSDNSSSYEDNSDNSSNYEDNSDNSSSYEDNSDNSSSYEDNSDNSSSYEDDNDNSSSYADNSDNTSDDNNDE